MDKISIKGITCEARIGVPDNEREFPQRLEVDVICELDLTDAISSDEFAKTLDYEKVVQVIQNTAASNRWSLVETLAAAFSDAILNLPRVRLTEVQVKKFPTSLRNQVRYVSATLRRRK